MTELGKQLKALHDASMADIAATKDLAGQRFKEGDVQGTVDALTGMMERHKARNLKPEQLATTSPSVSNTVKPAVSSTGKTSPVIGKNTLPKGMSMGKTTAIVAGIGLLTIGGVALYRQAHKPKQQSGSWTMRIEQERQQGISRQR